MKEWGSNSQDCINEEEISNLPEREYWTKIVKMLQRLENRMERLQEAFNTVNTITKSIEEINNLPEIEFRIMIVKMLQRLENRMEKMQETINTVSTITKNIE